ncbi:MAG: GNAT family N-acetyltransferase [Bacteroidetes bacterium]|nr:GNAT family N-acetyltransferase [Bacteroidota bacterium]
MELVEFYKPRRLSPARLDRYLAGGWFRSSNGLFRNQLLCLDGKLCTVVNIRLDLRTHQFRASQRKLLNRLSNCRVEIGPLDICDDMEHLYEHTKLRFKGFVFPNLHSFLYDFMDRAIFDSYQVRVYKNENLIAASIFDCGEKGIMSVLGLYHPAYKSWSPGILTMLLEIQWGMEQGFHYYYPGYVLDESDSFDYKQRLGRFQFLNKNHRWTYHYDEVVASSRVPNIVGKSDTLQAELEAKGIPHKRLFYKLFSLGYAYPEGTFLRHPLIFILPELSENPFKVSIASFNPESGLFQLSHPLPVQDEFLSQHQSKEFQDTETYYDLVLQENQEDTQSFTSARALANEVTKKLQRMHEQHGYRHISLIKTMS